VADGTTGGGITPQDDKPTDSALQPIQPAPLAKKDDLPDWLGLHAVQSLSTFDAQSQDGMRLMSKMQVGCDHELGTKVNETIDVVSFFMSPYEKVDAKTGEMKNLVFIGLVDATGKTYSCSSIGVRKSLLMFAREFGFKPWIPPIKVIVRSVKLEVGQMYALEFISREQPATATRKAK